MEHRTTVWMTDDKRSMYIIRGEIIRSHAHPQPQIIKLGNGWLHQRKSAELLSAVSNRQELELHA